MPDALTTALTVIALLVSGFATWLSWLKNKRQFTREDQQDLEKRLAFVLDVVERGQKDSNNKHEEVNSRVRKLESVQMTETKVQSMLDSKVQPLSDSIAKLETELKSVASEIQRGYREANSHTMQIIEELSYLRGTLEARRKDDIRRD